MITRKQALQLIEEHVANKNIIKHMIALEAVMGALAKKLQITNAKLQINKKEWMMAGLLHDGDYSDQVSVEKQGIQITEWAKAAGYEIPEPVAHAMAAHNWHNTGVEPESKMDWSIFCADSLTGLIVACALVLPSKKLADVSVEMVLKKFGQKAFAAGTRRDEIALCQEKLEISLEEFVRITLRAMQSIAGEIGL
jgi:predicted hydrolase (HD superfamily)